jgi:hypothetical protein
MTSSPRPPVVLELDGLSYWYMRIEKWCQMTAMSPAGVYRHAKDEHIVLRKLGSRTLVDVRQSLPFLENLPLARVGRRDGRGRWPKYRYDAQISNAWASLSAE